MEMKKLSNFSCFTYSKAVRRTKELSYLRRGRTPGASGIDVPSKHPQGLAPSLPQRYSAHTLYSQVDLSPSSPLV